MGMGGQSGEGCSSGDCVKTESRYSWEEIQKHNLKTDKWLVIERKVYNITEWVKRHPGGMRVIGHYAGEDATDAFHAFHPDKSFVRKFLKPLYVGELAENEPSQDRDKNAQQVEDFRALRKTAEDMGLFKSNPAFFVFYLFHIILIEFLAWCTLHYLGTGWIPSIITVLLLTTSQAQAGWLQHDFGHLSVFEKSKWNHFVHKFVIGHLKTLICKCLVLYLVGFYTKDLTEYKIVDSVHPYCLPKFKGGYTRTDIVIQRAIFKGASANWWNHRHFQHHAKPNIFSKDPDVNMVNVFVLGNTQPVEFGKKGIKYLPYNNQHLYFFLIGPPLLIPVYFTIQIIKTMISRKDWVDLAWSVSYYARFFIMFVPFFGVLGSLALLNAVRFFESHWFVWVTQMNHLPMAIDHEKYQDWLNTQLAATCNIEPSFFNDWFSGHLNFQIEHHLFPTMPRHNYWKISPLVRSLCNKYNVTYEEKCLYHGFRDVFRSLKKSGQLWLDAYLHK